jgi:hypothetical protein
MATRTVKAKAVFQDHALLLGQQIQPLSQQFACSLFSIFTFRALTLIIRN